MNIKFNYLYRDGSNYKQYNEVIFSNPNAINVLYIWRAIKHHLISGQWFVAKEWALPDMHFKEYLFDTRIDHDWHEFEDVEETLSNPTQDGTIDDFLLVIANPEIWDNDIKCRAAV